MYHKRKKYRTAPREFLECGEVHCCTNPFAFSAFDARLSFGGSLNVYSAATDVAVGSCNFSNTQKNVSSAFGVDVDEGAKQDTLMIPGSMASAMDKNDFTNFPNGLAVQ